MDDYEHQESYRSELTAALLRIEHLEDEVALFRTDPAYERVDIAQERLTRARARRERIQKLLPRICIASFVAMGAFALTDPSLPTVVHVLAYAICVLGGAAAVATIVWMLLYAAQGARPRRLRELERQVRIAKGDVGKRLRVEVGNDAARAHDVGALRMRELPERADDESADPVARQHEARL